MPSRILIVDDNEVACHLLKRLLEKKGYEVFTAADARDGLQIIESAQPSLVVSDYEMPELSGAQLCELVRGHMDPEIAGLPLILLTANAGDQHEIECLEAGANDFVTKPVNPAILMARIETQLRLHSLRRELELQKTELEQWRRTHELDLEAAQITQQAILPVRLPRIEGWETAAHYQPVIQVGGDMYDWVRLPDGRWLFWMSDATGHGASAALLTSLAKLVFRHAASELSRPAEILQAANAEFHATLRGKSFMTAACLALTQGEDDIVFAGAGHPPLLIVRRDGTVEWLPSQSPPLGIIAQREFTRTFAQLHTGDLALLYTDGLYSAARRGGEHLAPSDLEPFLPRHAGSASAFISELVAAVQSRNAEATLPDDLALIALRRME